MAPPRRRNRRRLPKTRRVRRRGARRGRPTVYSDKVLAMMKDYARRLGFSDTAAAEGVGVSSTTISRWKKECPEIAHELQTARQECRVHHLERIMEFAEGDNNRGLRASMWLLERLFPGDYAPRMAERFAYMNLEDRQREREEEAWQRVHEREPKAEPSAAAEAQEKYLAVLAAYEAESRNTRRRPARGRRASRRWGRTGGGENPAPPLKSDSHNSRNSGEAEPAAQRRSRGTPRRARGPVQQEPGSLAPSTQTAKRHSRQRGRTRRARHTDRSAAAPSESMGRGRPSSLERPRRRKIRSPPL